MSDLTSMYKRVEDIHDLRSELLKVLTKTFPDFHWLASSRILDSRSAQLCIECSSKRLVMSTKVPTVVAQSFEPQEAPTYAVKKSDAELLSDYLSSGQVKKFDLHGNLIK